jgi:hypothetical protein
MADPQRQSGLYPFKRLTLALLIAAEHQRTVGRIQIQPDDIPELLLELRIAGDFEGDTRWGFRSFRRQIR